MEEMKRTVDCGSLNLRSVGKGVVLNGWVHRLRDHGGIKFIDLRDRYGITQVVLDPDADAALAAIASELKFEYCIAVEGTVRPRPTPMVNPRMATGEIEVLAAKIAILSKSETLPFMVDERSEAKEELRFRYRYLDLRSLAMQRNIKLRHEVTFAVREYLVGQGFYEIETPTLIRSTPEGARDFLVPSRIQRSLFYALPQSPQLYKQLLMVSGFDRYFQIAHCFRDEDARGDRQPEHTQIDIEMSFVSKEDVFSLIEGMLRHVFEKTLQIELQIPFPRLSYSEAMDRYGTDKPDLRFDLPLLDASSWAGEGAFQVFQNVIKEGGAVRGLRVPNLGSYSRKQISELEEVAKIYGAKGLAWMKVTEQGLDGGISKFYSDIQERVLESLHAENGDLILLVGSDWKTACTSLGAVRTHLGKSLGLTAATREFKFCWIVDFPLFEWNEEEGKWDPAHHMFTMPQASYLDTLEEDPGSVKGDLYDLVGNGVELASGSIRIHNPELQRRIFNIVGFSEEEAERRFGFLLRSFRYGPPPHGGIAPGLDRIVMLMAGESTIRDVIAFPKNTVAASPMDECPSEVDPAQLEELGLRLIEEEPKE
jgi:aspartyl-tRNA synthetase